MNWSERDAAYVWHPYTHLKSDPGPIPIVRAKGSLLIGEDGREYIDAISSWWTNLHGHAHPLIGERIAGQFAALDHVLFAGATHPAAIQLAENLLRLLPGQQSKAFFSDDGSTAVEVAVKLALQFWQNVGEDRRTLIAFENAYHGDTFGAMSVSGRGIFTAAFDSFLFDVRFVKAPTDGREEESLTALRRVLEENRVAAFIFEPLVQGAGGMILHEAAGLDALLGECRRQGVLTIADEVMTGFGRTGKLFACEGLRHSPDIVCLSKGLTGGVLPLAVTTCAKALADAFVSDDRRKTFFHGHSYTGNPIACAAALASLELVTSDECGRQRHRIGARHRSFIERLRACDRVKNPRSLGTILAFDLDDNPSYLSAIRNPLIEYALSRGVWLRPLGNVLYCMPPYCTTDEQLSRVYDVMENAVDFVRPVSSSV